MNASDSNTSCSSTNLDAKGELKKVQRIFIRKWSWYRYTQLRTNRSTKKILTYIRMTHNLSQYCYFLSCRLEHLWWRRIATIGTQINYLRCKFTTCFFFDASTYRWADASAKEKWKIKKKKNKKKSIKRNLKVNSRLWTSSIIKIQWISFVDRVNDSNLNWNRVYMINWRKWKHKQKGVIVGIGVAAVAVTAFRESRVWWQMKWAGNTVWCL